MTYDYEINLKLNDKIRIGHDIVISVCRLGTKNTDFGCEAPKSISLLLEELLKIKEIIIEEVLLK